MGRLILARSGMTEYDEDERIAGSLDMPLSTKGIAEAEDLARDLKSFEVEAVYAAAGEASLATAQLIAEEHDLKVKQLPELRNQNFGTPEQRTGRPSWTARVSVRPQGIEP